MIFHGAWYPPGMPKPNDTQINIRINRELVRRFQALCAERDTTPSQVIRRYIRKYVAADSGGPVHNRAENRTSTTDNNR